MTLNVYTRDGKQSVVGTVTTRLELEVVAEALSKSGKVHADSVVAQPQVINGLETAQIITIGDYVAWTTT